MTGWGQEGPLARSAGHDINYIALAGALYHIGLPGGPPVPPLNLVGDFGGGGLLLAFGVLAALFERNKSGQGQVVDAAMIDGAALLTTASHTRKAAGTFSDTRGRNVLDGGAHFYGVYETADGEYVSVGSIEPQFYAQLLELTGLSADELGDQYDPDTWPAARARVAAVIRTKSRDQWCIELEGTDLCFAPVLSIHEVHQHPHHRERDGFVNVGGIIQPAPAPRFSRSIVGTPRPPAVPGEHTDAILAEFGISAEDRKAYRLAGIIP
jgi:alpha-methylacyl-CoA racemase